MNTLSQTLVPDEKLIEQAETLLPLEPSSPYTNKCAVNIRINYGVIPFNSNPLDYPRYAILNFVWTGKAWKNTEVKRLY